MEFVQRKLPFTKEWNDGKMRMEVDGRKLWTPMLLVMLLLVRHAGVLRPVPTAALAVLSAAGLSSAAVSLVHGQESAALTLLWHGGAVLLLCALAALSGRPLLG